MLGQSWCGTEGSCLNCSGPESRVGGGGVGEVGPGNRVREVGVLGRWDQEADWGVEVLGR